MLYYSQGENKMLPIPNPPMKVRGTPLYLGMTVVQAVEIIKAEDTTPEENKTAWQWLVDTGLLWDALEGSYARMGQEMIDMGILDDPDEVK
jgi:hypothetical protein